MKLILSRKGFDAATGRFPSPILPSGQLCSLPIPDNHPERQKALRFYQDIQAAGVSLGQLVADLSRERILPTTPTHLDPDLNAASVSRPPGGGVFPRFHEGLRLTDPASQQRSLWRLPAWFHPANRPSALSYHGRSDRWQRVDGAVQLATVGRGQEFVLDIDHYPEALAWLRTLFTDSFSHHQAPERGSKPMS